MSYGLTSYTDSGSLLTSADAKCLHFVGVAAYTGAPTSTTAQYTVTSPARPLVFARLPIGGLACVYSVTNVGNTWTIRTCGPNRASLTLLCFAPLTTEAALEPYGLRLLTAAGHVSFDTSRKPLWLSEVFSEYGATLTPSTMTASYARAYTNMALTIYATAQSTPGQGGGIYYLGLKRLTTGHVYDWCTFDSGTGTPTTASRVNSSVFVIESNGIA